MAFCLFVIGAYTLAFASVRIPRYSSIIRIYLLVDEAPAQAIGCITRSVIRRRFRSHQVPKIPETTQSDIDIDTTTIEFLRGRVEAPFLEPNYSRFEVTDSPSSHDQHELAAAS